MTRANPFAITGQTALVTGAASGIGRAIALSFAQAGANVACADRDLAAATAVADEANTFGATCRAYDVDVSDKISVEAMALAAEADFGEIGLLVNSAGVSERHPAESFPEAGWDRIIDINLKGTFLCCQTIGRSMIARGRGRIVNMSSIAGAVAYHNTVAYLSSKGGVVQMTKGLAVEWGRHGITVNAVAPGLVRTPLLEKFAQEDPERVNWFLSRMAIGKLIEPDDVAAATLFLCSPAARMITGHVLAVEGGYLAL